MGTELELIEIKNYHSKHEINTFGTNMYLQQIYYF